MSDAPYLSVVTPSMRVGGLDILFAGLWGQTFQDFELILVDALHDYRVDVVAERHAQACAAGATPFTLVHRAPETAGYEWKFPWSAFCRCANTGLDIARGQVVMFMVDYTWLPPDSLAYHAAFHQDGDPLDALTLPAEYRAVPPLREGWPSYGPTDAPAYAAAVRDGTHALDRWSIFQQPLTSTRIQALPIDAEWGGADPKLTYPLGVVPDTFFHGKNDSVRLEHLRAIGGWGEYLDGGHGYQDNDLSDRLSIFRDVRWNLTPGPQALIVNPRKKFPHAQWIRSMKENEDLWRDRQARQYR